LKRKQQQRRSLAHGGLVAIFPEGSTAIFADTTLAGIGVKTPLRPRVGRITGPIAMRSRSPASRSPLSRTWRLLVSFVAIAAESLPAAGV
jgi:hypothetical protein